jgi:hypothetical protein
MRVGVLLLPTDPWPETVARVRHLEALGYSHVWTYDHLSWRHYRDEQSRWLAKHCAAIGRDLVFHDPRPGDPVWTEDPAVVDAIAEVLR